MAAGRLLLLRRGEDCVIYKVDLNQPGGGSGMFFRKDYAAPGPGVDPDEPEKTGLARLGQIDRKSVV